MQGKPAETHNAFLFKHLKMKFPPELQRGLKGNMPMRIVTALEIRIARYYGPYINKMRRQPVR